MQKIDKLLAQDQLGFRPDSNASQTAAGQVRADSDRPLTAGEAGNGPQSTAGAPDHVDALNQLFAEFELAYHNQFHKAFPDPEAVVIAKKYWLSHLQQFLPDQIINAGKALILSQDYLPTIGALVRSCEQCPGVDNLPPVRLAYIEACTAPAPKVAFAWSHPAVYLAGKASDWYFLANESEARTFPVYEYNYNALRDRVRNGESLSVEIAPALNEISKPTLDREELRKRLAILRQNLGV